METAKPSPPTLSAFRRVPRTGVIFVTTEAEKRGFSQDAPGWCNLGQGQPETGTLPHAPDRLTSLEVRPDMHEYAPVPGLPDLRAAVADFYNRRFRKGMASQYTAENVAICGGGRLALSRAAVALGEVNLGHFLPDYTAYEELLGVFKLFHPIPILLEPESNYQFSPRDLRREILGRGLSALLLSNPCNPTGRALVGDELAAWVKLSRELDCAMLMDEFYSHYIWTERTPAPIVSAAAYVDDVDKDPVIIFDGLTKNWRYPGLRVAWTVGPKRVIEAVASAGSFLDGGGSRPAQAAAVPLLDDAFTDGETKAIRETFAPKRDLLVDGLRDAGVQIDLAPEGSFYVWGSVANLPSPLNTGLGFFRAMLEEQVICVPGQFFDINPGRRRASRPSRFSSHLRFSFGPDVATLQTALERIQARVRRAQKEA